MILNIRRWVIFYLRTGFKPLKYRNILVRKNSKYCIIETWRMIFILAWISVKGKMKAPICSMICQVWPKFNLPKIIKKASISRNKSPIPWTREKYFKNLNKYKISIVYQSTCIYFRTITEINTKKLDMWYIFFNLKFYT